MRIKLQQQNLKTKNSISLKYHEHFHNLRTEGQMDGRTHLVITVQTQGSCRVRCSKSEMFYTWILVQIFDMITQVWSYHNNHSRIFK